MDGASINIQIKEGLQTNCLLLFQSDNHSREFQPLIGYFYFFLIQPVHQKHSPNSLELPALKQVLSKNKL
ncbi:MAG: hypothetical protein NPIRA06_26060 [Nitrospirales bacterium]|nr:MAG: hypothetical protein NPIRA06_26060 [Nitrospirales bacterium]